MPMCAEPSNKRSTIEHCKEMEATIVPVIEEEKELENVLSVQFSFVVGTLCTFVIT